MKYQHILSEVLNTPWAILESKLHLISALLVRKAAGETISASEVALIKQEPRLPYLVECDVATIDPDILAAMPKDASRSRAGSIAVLPLFGTISHRMGLLSEMSGGTSAERFTGWLRAALADSTVASIVIDVDSPGGTVAGIPELADEIYQARKVKPVVAVANAQAASAAYWLATQAQEFAVTPSAEVGSVGVFAAHQDVSKAAEEAGVRTSLISAGKYKTEGNPFEPLSEEARAALQAKVDAYYSMFTRAVARGRGVTQTEVQEGFGQGRMVSASEAVSQKMADRMATMDQTLRRLGAKTRAALPAKAEDPKPKMKSRRERELELRTFA